VALLADATGCQRIGDLETAKRHYRCAVALVPDEVEALNGHGAADLRAGQAVSAAHMFVRAGAIDPAEPRVVINSALAAIDCGQIVPDRLVRALILGPGLASLLEAFGTGSVGPPIRARWLSRACAVGIDTSRLIRVASLLAADGERARAVRAARQAIALAPSYAAALNCLGALVYDGANPAGARFFARGLKADELHAAAWANLSLVWHDTGQLKSALVAARRAQALDPSLADGHGNFGNAALEAASAKTAVVALRRAVMLDPSRQGLLSNLVMALSYLGGMGEVRAATAASWWRRRPSAPRPARRSAERLRVGYVSSFSLASTRHLGLSAIRRHDPARVNLIAYVQRRRGSSSAIDLGPALREVREISGMSDVAVAELISDDAVDVLVDLSGHTPGNRLGVFALRPARTQVTWIESFCTTGLPAMDWIVTDADHSPPGLRQDLVERPLRLDRPRFSYSPPDYAPAPAAAPSLRRGYTTFGCFNYPPKISDEALALWASILLELPDARLRLKWWSMTQPDVAAVFRARFARHGVAADRVELSDASSHDAMLAEYGDIDVALDTFPFTGGVTTCEASWMGVPVVTLCGASMIERQSACLLRAVGAGDLVAEDANAYRQLALELASDEAGRSVRRRALRDSMRSSLLLDPVDAARALEAAYRRAHDDVGGGN
jgi:predicted O-linked N-acetylglucosamine transferase (SPINDLY family)